MKQKREHTMFPPPFYVSNTLVGLIYGCPYVKQSIKTSFSVITYSFSFSLVNLR